jgi:hypothetical protein
MMAVEVGMCLALLRELFQPPVNGEEHENSTVPCHSGCYGIKKVRKKGG